MYRPGGFAFGDSLVSADAGIHIAIRVVGTMTDPPPESSCCKTGYVSNNARHLRPDQILQGQLDSRSFWRCIEWGKTLKDFCPLRRRDISQFMQLLSICLEFPLHGGRRLGISTVSS